MALQSFYFTDFYKPPLCVESLSFLFLVNHEFVCLTGGNCRQELAQTLIHLPIASQVPPVTEDIKEFHGHVVQTLRNSSAESVTHTNK